MIHVLPQLSNVFVLISYVRPIELIYPTLAMTFTLRALWNEAEEWHLLSTDHCDVYGFNIWPPAWLGETSDMIFGDAEARKKWLIKQ